MFAGLSSTISILPISSDHGAARHGAPDLSGKAIAANLGLFHDRRHVSAQLRAIVARDFLGGHYEDRDACRIRVLVERSHDVEPVYVGHHQIEHYYVGKLLTCELD